MNAKRIRQALEVRYRLPLWASFRELRAGSGYGKRSEQRIDLWTINTQPHQHLKRIAFEIKVSRADFLHELEQPLKRRGALILSNQYYFVTPVGLVKPSELPIECGLIEIAETGFKKTPEGGGWFYYGFARSPWWYREVVDAPVRESVLPTWRFVASLARRMIKIEQETQDDSTDTQEIHAERDGSDAAVPASGLALPQV